MWTQSKAAQSSGRYTRRPLVGRALAQTRTIHAPQTPPITYTHTHTQNRDATCIRVQTVRPKLIGDDCVLNERHRASSLVLQTRALIAVACCTEPTSHVNWGESVNLLHSTFHSGASRRRARRAVSRGEEMGHGENTGASASVGLQISTCLLCCVQFHTILHYYFGICTVYIIGRVSLICISTFRHAQGN